MERVALSELRKPVDSVRQCWTSYILTLNSRHVTICPQLYCFCLGVGDGPGILCRRQKGTTLEGPACPHGPPPTSDF